MVLKSSCSWKPYYGTLIQLFMKTFYIKLLLWNQLFMGKEMIQPILLASTKYKFHMPWSSYRLSQAKLVKL